MEIKISNLNYAYEKINYKPKEIFSKLNIKFNEGINCIIGDNGQGKTTLLDIINGDLKHKSGKVIKSTDKIGYVKETPLFVTDTVREELIYNLIEHDHKVSEKRLYDALLMVGLDSNLMDSKISTLTYSQKRLLDLACAIIYNPRVLLIDNLTQDLSDVDKKNIIKLVRLLKKRYDKLIIIASNDLEFVHKVADKIIVLYDKRVVLEGTKYDVFKNEKLLKQYNLSVPNIIKFENLVLDKKGIKLGYRDEINDLIKDIFRNTY